MLRKLVYLLLIIFFTLLESFSQNIVFPLKIDILSAIPLKSEDAQIKYLYKDKEYLYFSIKENDIIEYRKFSIDSLKIRYFSGIIKKKFVKKAKKEREKIEVKRGRLFYYKNNRIVWKRDAPDILIQDYYISDKLITIIFKNGLLNIFSKSGTLIFWKTLDYKVKYIIDTEKGVFIFSSKRYYYFDKKEKKIKKGKLNLDIADKPIVIEDNLYIWGLKQNADFFVIEKLSSIIGIKIDYDKPEYFKGDKIELKIKKYNLKKLKVSINLISDKQNIEIVKKSKKKKFSMYLSFEGKTILNLFFEAKDFKKEIRLVFYVKDKNKLIKKILDYIYDNCYLLREEKR